MTDYLDPQFSRLFPTQAKQVRRSLARGRWFLCGLCFVAGLAVGVLLIGYHLHVATTNLHTWGGRLVLLEQEYQREHHRSLRTTAGQAAVIVERRERR
jgi:hypothetical protein